MSGVPPAFCLRKVETQILPGIAGLNDFEDAVHQYIGVLPLLDGLLRCQNRAEIVQIGGKAVPEVRLNFTLGEPAESADPPGHGMRNQPEHAGNRPLCALPLWEQAGEKKERCPLTKRSGICYALGGDSARAIHHQIQNHKQMTAPKNCRSGEAYTLCWCYSRKCRSRFENWPR